MTIAEAQRHGETVLRRAGIESCRIDSSLLLEKVTGRPRAWLIAHLEELLPDEQGHVFMELVNRRTQREPLVHLTNTSEFYGLKLFVDGRVLSPRVETEQMVDWAIKYAPQDSRLLDMGTGSGALALAIKQHRPDLGVWASDVSAEALEVANLNATRFNLFIKTLRSNLWTSLGEQKFATVVTNLPYLRDDAELMPEVKREPEVALRGGEDGLELYRQFLQELPEHLEPGGYLFTECDPWQQAELIKGASAVGLKPIESGYFILGFKRH